MMLFRRIFQATALVVWVFLSSAVLFAQSERGTVTGTVRDSTGAVVPKARVVVTNLDTKLVSDSQTNDAGDYTAASLPVGPYEVRVERQGFRPVVSSGITLNAASMVRVALVNACG